MPSKQRRARTLALAAQREQAAKDEAGLESRRAAAANARKVLAEKRAAGLAKPPRKRASVADATTFVGRIESRLAAMGKTVQEFEAAIGVGRYYVRHVRRAGYKFRPPLMLKAAEWLGVSPEWLANGDAGAVVAVPKPNGHAVPLHSKVEAALHSNADAAMASLWGLLAADVKVFLVARAAELLAQHARQSRG
jgi:hypothetical protein